MDGPLNPCSCCGGILFVPLNCSSDPIVLGY
ncbi:hypothetical protein MG5_04329 [Candida albicans P57072]|nr:hypothetical protein MG1_04328 [Candida albicans GC75]KGR05819.1 hypothetical protein MG5_04329 [Candida albicans P57072]KHC32894.1 hypothetical protein MGO_04295 [Candida albicans P76055]KHC32964.1 hypothetical protein MGQ_04303 [Candida albicans P76067]